MKTIIAGSRTFNDYRYMCKCLNLDCFKNKISVVISGTANGADKLGERWAKENNIPIKKFPADWNKYRKAAGIIRNIEMAKHGDILIAFWDGKSKGTNHMINHAREVGLKVYVFQDNLKDLIFYDNFKGIVL